MISLAKGKDRKLMKLLFITSLTIILKEIATTISSSFICIKSEAK